MLEMMIALAILTLLLFLAVPSFSLLRRQVSLNNVSRELQSALRLAQGRAMAAQGGAVTTHGVRLEADRYIILGDIEPQIFYLPAGITISGGSGQTVTFTRLTGLPNLNQEIILSAGASQQVVRLEESGLISLP